MKICEVCGSDHNVEKYKGTKYLCSRHYTQMLRKGVIYDTRFEPSIIVECDSYAEIIIKDIHNNEKCRVKISLDKISKVKEYRWRFGSKGYIEATINNTKIRLHNIIMEPPEGYIVDHINRDKLDNRNENLRLCLQIDNAKNLSKYKTNTSGVHGVSYNKKSNKWRTEIMCNGEKIYLGEYINLEDATKVRKEAEKKYFGEFAPLQ